MLRIGVFAKFARTSVNVLRYYADVNGAVNIGIRGTESVYTLLYG